MTCSMIVRLWSIKTLLSAELLELSQGCFLLSGEMADVALKSYLLRRGRGGRRT